MAITYEKEVNLKPTSSYWNHLEIPYSVKYNSKSYSVVAIGECAFEDSSDLLSVTIPSSVKTIGAAAFYGCTSLKSVNIPNGVTKIDAWTFRNCTSLTSLELPKTVTQVYPDAFSLCSAMTSLTVLSPEAPTLMSTSTFDLPSTCKLYIPAQGYPSYKTEWSYFSNRLNIANYDYDKTQGLPTNFIEYTTGNSYAISACSTNATKVGSTFENGKGIWAYDGPVTSISDNGFGQSNVTTVNLPTTVTSIGYRAFYRCRALTTLDLPENVTSIGADAFNTCTSLTSFVVNNPVPGNISLGSNAIPSNVAGNCILYVPAGSKSAYSAAPTWNTFKEIREPSLVIEQTELTLTIGQTGTLTTVLDPADPSAKITWTSSNPQVAKVNNGVVTAVKDGTAEITASCNGFSATCTVNVNPIVATSVTLNKTSLSILIGSTANLSATVAPDNTTYPTVEWTSSNTNVATVSTSGVVTAVAVGTANITAKCGTVSASCYVTVNPIVATSVSLNKTSVSIMVGNTETLTATVAPDNTTDKTITWSSSNTNVATVSTSGVVTAVAVGTANITAKCGSVSKMCVVTVTPMWTTVGIKYTKNNDNTSYRVSGFDSNLPSNVIIPSEYNSLPVTEIGANAFQDCRTITSVVIPSSVTKIGDYAFNWCTSLTSAEVPSSVSTFGKGTSQRCSALRQFTGSLATSDNRCIIKNGVLYGFAPSGLTSYSIPSTVISIGAGVFDGCKNLSSITIPASVTSIGESAFYACEALTSITLPSGITKIDNGVFWGCENLTSVNIQGNVTTIGSNAFYNCMNLASITLPNTVTSIGNSAFGECSALTSITIPNSVTSIGDYAFRNCSSLSAFNGKFASSDNRCLIINNTLRFFAPAGITEYSIPNTVTSIDQQAFYNCSGLTKITIPASVNSIGNYAFSDCTGLTSITIENPTPANISLGTTIFDGVNTNTCVLYVPKNSVNAYKVADQWGDFKNIWELVTTVGLTYTLNSDNASYSVSGYTSDLPANVNIPSEYNGKPVNAIANNAFKNCGIITDVEMPNTITSIGDYAFYGCSGLTEVVFSKSLKNIGELAFQSCSSILKIDLPDSLERISISAFAQCAKLKSVNFGSNIILLEDNVFIEDRALKELVFPESLINIPNGIIAYCSSLERVTYGSQVEYIGNDAFTGVSGLREVISLNPVPPTFGTWAVKAPSNAVLYVPAGSRDAYASARIWKDFKSIEEIKNPVYTLNDATEYSETTDLDCVDITYTRNFVNDQVWQCLYIPFDMSFEEWDGKARVAKFNNIHEYYNDVTGELERTVFEYVTVTEGNILPNKPYLIKPNAVGNVTFECNGKHLAAAPEEDGFVRCSSTETNYTLYGTYTGFDRGVLNGMNAYVIGANGFGPASEKAALSPQRFYLLLTVNESGYGSEGNYEGTTPSRLPERIEVMVDGDTVGIADVVVEREDGAYYDLQGRRIANPERGIFIHNGKKVIIK